MSLSISELTDAEEDEYEAFHLSVPASLLYGSARYRRFLAAVLPHATSHYLIARCSGRIAAALPSFRLDCGGVGSVINSLPFYGSHGGVIGPHAEAGSAARALLAEFAGWAAGASAATIVSSPLEGSHPLYEQVFQFRFRGERIGQMTSLPPPDRDVDDALMARLHGKTRNTVRKGQKSGLTFAIDGEPAALGELARLHREGMATLGGLAKPWSVFEALRACFRWEHDYLVYTARDGDRIVSALLVLFYNRTVEYYTPVTDPDYRALQPMSALIFRAMHDAVRRGFVRWNWGGTWITQTGVHDFKRRWGTTDLPYFYYTAVNDPGLLKLDRARLLSAFPGFFVVPFSELRSCSEQTLSTG